MIITNIRGREEDFNLDKQEFHVGPFETSVVNMGDVDDVEIKGQYYTDVVAHVKKM
jgi:hypothetical protein